MREAGAQCVELVSRWPAAFRSTCISQSGAHPFGYRLPLPAGGTLDLRQLPIIHENLQSLSHAMSIPYS
jgi:hypothetical protein